MYSFHHQNDTLYSFMYTFLLSIIFLLNIHFLVILTVSLSACQNVQIKGSLTFFLSACLTGKTSNQRLIDQRSFDILPVRLSDCQNVKTNHDPLTFCLSACLTVKTSLKSYKKPGLRLVYYSS